MAQKKQQQQQQQKVEGATTMVHTPSRHGGAVFSVGMARKVIEARRQIFDVSVHSARVIEAYISL